MKRFSPRVARSLPRRMGRFNYCRFSAKEPARSRSRSIRNVGPHNRARTCRTCTKLPIGAQRPARRTSTPSLVDAPGAGRSSSQPHGGIAPSAWAVTQVPNASPPLTPRDHHATQRTPGKRLFRGIHDLRVQLFGPATACGRNVLGGLIRPVLQPPRRDARGVSQKLKLSHRRKTLFRASSEIIVSPRPR